MAETARENQVSSAAVKYETVADMGSGLVIAKVKLTDFREQDINCLLYTSIPVDYKELDDQKPEEQPAEEEDPVISQEQRQQLFKAAQANFGKDKGNAVVKSIIEEMGLTSTTGMKMSTYNKVVERLVEICAAHKAELEAEESTKNDGAAEE